MTVLEAEPRPDGKLVIGGTDPVLDVKTKDEIRALFGTRVRLVAPDGTERVCNVAGVDTSESLVGRKNVFALLEASLPAATSPVGCNVYSMAG